MTRETFLDTGDDLAWALDVHCRALSDNERAELRRYPRALILYGNEDCPEQIDIFSTSCPMNGEEPIISLMADRAGALSIIRRA